MIEAPLAPAQLAARWQALCADPTFEDVAGKIELTETPTGIGESTRVLVTFLPTEGVQAAESDIVKHAADRVMIKGEWRVEHGQPLGVDVARLRHDHGEAAKACVV